MSNTKQKILSELKSKLTQFKSKLKSHKTIDEQKVDDELILKISPNKNKDTNINKENIDNNIIINKPIKTSKIERANSTYSSIVNSKKYLDFDIDKILNQTKQHSISKSNINIDDISNIINKNKTFINLNIVSNKKIISKTERQKKVLNLIKDDYINKYESNYSEPNVDSYKKIRFNNNYNNNGLFQNRYSNFSTNDITKNINERERFSAKPEIRTDISRYNLNFMTNNKNNIRKNSAKLFNNNNIRKIGNKNDNYTANIKNILYNNTRKTNFNIINGINNNKYLTSSHTTYNYNGYNNFNKENVRKNYFSEIENDKRNSYDLNMNDIHKVKYMIQNLSSDQINNLPISVFREMKDLYDLIYRKFLQNNFI